MLLEDGRPGYYTRMLAITAVQGGVRRWEARVLHQGAGYHGSHVDILSAVEHSYGGCMAKVVGCFPSTWDHCDWIASQHMACECEGLVFNLKTPGKERGFN